MNVICKYPDKMHSGQYAKKLFEEYLQTAKYKALSEEEKGQVISHTLIYVGCLIKYSTQATLAENLTILSTLNSSKQKFEAIDLSTKERNVINTFKDIFRTRYTPESLIRMITGKKNYTPESEWIPFRPKVQELYKEYVKEVLDRCIKDLIVANSPNPNTKKVSFKTKIEEVRIIPRRHDDNIDFLPPGMSFVWVKKSPKTEAVISSSSIATSPVSSKSKTSVVAESKENTAESARKRRRLK